MTNRRVLRHLLGPRAARLSRVAQPVQTAQIVQAMRPSRAMQIAQALLLLLVTPFIALEAAHAQRSEPIIATGDTLIGQSVNGVLSKQLTGHVQFVQGPLYGSADHAIQYPEENRIELIGHVQIHQDSLALISPKAAYNGVTKVASATGGIQLDDRDVIILADHGDYQLDNQVAHLEGGVTISQPPNHGRADNLTYFRLTQTTTLAGHAEVRNDTGSIAADTITYSKALGETLARGNVRLHQDSLQLLADWFYNAPALHRTFARGNVELFDSANHTIVFGDTIARFSDQNYTVIPKHPLLLSIDSTLIRDSLGQPAIRHDTLWIVAKQMEVSQGDSLRFHASDSVQLLRGDFAARTAQLYFDNHAGYMTLSGGSRQHVWMDSTEMDADSILVRMHERKLHQVLAFGHAVTTNPDTVGHGRMNQLIGAEITADILNDTLHQVHDIASAMALYFVNDNKNPNGVNRVSGDTIRMDFKNKAVARVTVISGTEGEYFPEKFVKGRAQAFRLPGVERHNALRPKRTAFVLPVRPTAEPPRPTR